MNNIIDIFNDVSLSLQQNINSIINNNNSVTITSDKNVISSDKITFHQLILIIINEIRNDTETETITVKNNIISIPRNLTIKDRLNHILGILDISQTKDWINYVNFDLKKNYTRNLIATDNETFTLMILCWTPGKESPIHDHPCRGCWMLTLDGSVKETRYTIADNKQISTAEEISDKKFVSKGYSVYQPGDVIYIDDSIGLHNIGATDSLRKPRLSEKGGAITLHLYFPPFKSCRAWLDENNPSKVIYPKMCYYSEYGKIINNTKYP